MSKVNTNISYVPNLINKASLPPNLHRLLSMVFSNLMDRAILCRASNRSRKKVNFAGCLGTNSRKNRPISRKFRSKLREKQSVKTADFMLIFRENSLEIDRFWADQISILNVFLTEVIICSLNNNTLQKWINGKVFNIITSAQVFAT